MQVRIKVKGKKYRKKNYKLVIVILCILIKKLCIMKLNFVYIGKLIKNHDLIWRLGL